MKVNISTLPAAVRGEISRTWWLTTYDFEEHSPSIAKHQADIAAMKVVRDYLRSKRALLKVHKQDTPEMYNPFAKLKLAA